MDRRVVTKQVTIQHNMRDSIDASNTQKKEISISQDAAITTSSPDFSCRAFSISLLFAAY